MTLGLCLLDFVPNLAFLTGSIFYIFILSKIRGKLSALTAIVGTAAVFTSGMFKALSKLNYLLDGNYINWLNDIQFLLLAPGFVALLISAIFMVRSEKTSHIPGTMAIIPFKMPLIVILTISSLGFLGILIRFAFQNKNRVSGYCFIISVFSLLTMSYLTSHNQTLLLQWAEEFINSTGQIAFAIGTFFLWKSTFKRKSTN